MKIPQEEQEQLFKNNYKVMRFLLYPIIRTGSFIGAGDGFHNAEGLAKVIRLGDASLILRLEKFKSTNGPNLHLYLATDRLKANNGNQKLQYTY